MKVKEILTGLIHNFEEFLYANAIVNEGVKIVYATVPQKVEIGYVIYGAVSLMDDVFGFEVSYNKYANTVEIRSQIFWFRKSLREIKRFLKEKESN